MLSVFGNSKRLRSGVKGSGGAKSVLMSMQSTVSVKKTSVEIVAKGCRFKETYIIIRRYRQCDVQEVQLPTYQGFCQCPLFPKRIHKNIKSKPSAYRVGKISHGDIDLDDYDDGNGRKDPRSTLSLGVSCTPRWLVASVPPIFALPAC